MKQPNPIKWRHFEAEIIHFCARWYLRYSSRLSPSGGTDAGTGTAGGSHHDLSVSAALCSRGAPFRRLLDSLSEAEG